LTGVGGGLILTGSWLAASDSLMRSSLRILVQYSVVRTSFFPLSYLYKAGYSLSVRITTLFLRRVDGVAAVYLRRGLAKGEIVYGLSDIDLSVIVEDRESGVEKVKEQVRSTYDTLSRFIPLLGAGDMELGVYSVAEFCGLYEDYDFHKYRFDEGRHTWRLLFGRDVVEDLPHLDDADLYLPAMEELKKWWALLSLEVLGGSDRRPFESKYLWYKAIAEASKVYLRVCHGEVLRGRAEALDRVRTYVPSEDGRLIDRVREYLRHLIGGEDVPEDELTQLFVSLASRSCLEAERKALAGSESRSVTVTVPDSEELLVGDGGNDVLEELERVAAETLGPYIGSVALIPQVEFSLDVLSNSDIDSLCLALVQNRPVPLEKLRQFMAIIGENRCATRLQPFIVVDGNVAFSLTAEETHSGTEIKSPGLNPLFFAMLSDRLARASGTSGAGSDRSIRCFLPPNTFEQAIQRRQARIDAILSTGDVYKMRTLDFLRFFWGAARSKLAARSLQWGEISIPLTSRQIVEQLEECCPGNSGWLNDLHGEYNKEVRGEESESYRFFSRSIDLLSSI